MKLPRHHRPRLLVALHASIIVVGITAAATTKPLPLECSGTPAYISDGECDGINNNESCGYDGGDCCSCTCFDTEGHICFDTGFVHCIDPTASCFGEDDKKDRGSHRSSEAGTSYSSFGGKSTPSSRGDTPVCSLDRIGDGDCDDENNNKDCSYDGGDCCSCTCIVGEYDCDQGFNCIDPAAACVDDDDHSLASGAGDGGSATSTCYPSEAGDGICNGFNNQPECGFDGGDCCECTCVDTPTTGCGEESKFDCIDPEAPSCSESSPPSFSQSAKRSTASLVLVAVGGSCVLVSSVAFLVLQYFDLAKKMNESSSNSSNSTVAGNTTAGHPQ